MTYIIIAETDGGLGHNTLFIWIRLADIYLFLLGKMYQLVMLE